MKFYAYMTYDFKTMSISDLSELTFGWGRPQRDYDRTHVTVLNCQKYGIKSGTIVVM